MMNGLKVTSLIGEVTKVEYQNNDGEWKKYSKNKANDKFVALSVDETFVATNLFCDSDDVVEYNHTDFMSIEGMSVMDNNALFSKLETGLYTV